MATGLAEYTQELRQDARRQPERQSSRILCSLRSLQLLCTLRSLRILCPLQTAILPHRSPNTCRPNAYVSTPRPLNASTTTVNSLCSLVPSTSLHPSISLPPSRLSRWNRAFALRHHFFAPFNFFAPLTRDIPIRGRAFKLQNWPRVGRRKRNSRAPIFKFADCNGLQVRTFFGLNVK